MALFDSFKSLVSKVTQPITSTLNKIIEAPVSQTGILGSIGRLADSTSRVASQVNPYSTANISTAVQPKPYLPPTPYGGAGPTGTQPAVVPQKAVPTGPYQNYTPAPPATQIVNPTPNRLFTPNPNVSTQYGAGFVRPDGTIELIDPNIGLPGGFSPVGGTILPKSELAPGQPYQPLISSQPTSSSQQKAGGTPPGQTTTGEPAQIEGQLPPEESPGASLSFGGSSGGRTAMSSGIAGGGAFGSSSGISIGLPSLSELKNKRTQVIKRADQNLGFGSLFRGMLGIPSANASTFPATGPYQGGGIPSGPNQNYTPAYNYSSNFGQTTVPSVNLTTEQQEFLGSTFGPSFNQGYITATNSPITGQEFSNATTNNFQTVPLKPTDTESQAKANLQNRVAQTFNIMNTRDNVVTEQIKSQASAVALQNTLSTSGGYVKVSDPTSGQINVARVNPDGTTSYVSLQEFQSKGLNIDHIPDVGQLGNEYTTQLNKLLSEYVDTATGKPYVKEDFQITENSEFRTEIDKKTKEIDDLVAKYKITDVPDMSARETAIAKEEGLPELKTQKRSLEDNIEALTGQFEKIADEIKNDPDFSSKLKSRRLAFFDTEKQRALAGFQRQLGLINDRIGDVEKTVNSKLNREVDTYNAKFALYKELDAEREKILARIEKANDNDRQLMTTILTQFGAGTLTAEQQAAIKSQLNNKSLIDVINAGLTNKQKSLQLQAQSVANSTPAGNTFVFNGQEFQGLKSPTGGNSALGSYTNDQVEKGAANAGVSIVDFQRFSPDAANLFINNYANVTATKTDIESRLKAGTSASQLEGMIAGLNLPPEAKDYLTKYLKSIASTFSGSGRKV